MNAEESSAIANRPSVLVIDDEVLITEVIRDALVDEYQTTTAHDAISGYEIAVKDQPDIILLDVNMPHESGLDLCKRLRENPATRRIPVVMVTGRNDLETLETAFDRGADDFISKPFNLRELRCRVAAKLRMVQELKDFHEGPEQETLLCGNLQLHRERLEISLDGKNFPLSVLEFNILVALVKNKDRILSRADLLAFAWSGVRVSERTVDAHIVSLRKKLQAFNHEIATIYGAGYILRAKADFFVANA